LQNRREHELKNNSKWRKYWKTLQKKETPEQREALQWERTFLLNLMVKFMRLLDTISETGDVSQDKVHYCERLLELMIDLEALLPTRRFFNTVLDDCHLVTRCKLSGLCKRDDGQLFSQVGHQFFFVTYLNYYRAVNSVPKSICELKFTFYKAIFLYLNLHY